MLDYTGNQSTSEAIQEAGRVKVCALWEKAFDLASESLGAENGKFCQVISAAVAEHLAFLNLEMDHLGETRRRLAEAGALYRASGDKKRAERVRHNLSRLPEP